MKTKDAGTIKNAGISNPNNIKTRFKSGNIYYGSGETVIRTSELTIEYFFNKEARGEIKKLAHRNGDRLAFEIVIPKGVNRIRILSAAKDELGWRYVKPGKMKVVV